MIIGDALENFGLSVLPQTLCVPEDCVLNWEGDLKNCWLTANYCILIACNVADLGHVFVIITVSVS